VTNTDYCASHTIFVRKYDNGVAVSVPNIASNGYTDTYTVGGMYTQDNLDSSTTANSIHPNAARLSQLSSKDASALQGVGTNRFNLSSLSGYQEASATLGYSGV
jgi:hypothetical protein